jgi:hypothetical protein
MSYAVAAELLAWVAISRLAEPCLEHGATPGNGLAVDSRACRADINACAQVLCDLARGANIAAEWIGLGCSIRLYASTGVRI